MAPSIFSRGDKSNAVAEKAEPAAAFSTEDDLDVVWNAVIVRCNKITSWDLNERKTITIDQVLAKINPPKDKDGSAEVKAAAKKVFKNALICVQRFGQFAATTASMVFGPSQQCFNAISFVISAVQDYDAVFGNITVLMERVSVFMEKLKIYLDDPRTNVENGDVKLDKRLRTTIYKVLDHFLTILGLSHKLTKGWKGKLKLAVEIGAFGKDEGIKDAMARLETLISDVISSEISVIVKDLSEAARNIRGVDRKLDQITDSMDRLENTAEKASASLGKLETGQEKAATALDHLTESSEKTNTAVSHLETAEQRRKAEEDDKSRFKEIRQALGVDEEKRPWATKQEELERRRIPGTGKWLFDMSVFSRWLALDDGNEEAEAPTLKPRVNAISVQADEGYGKSYLCGAIVGNLQEKYRDDPRTSLAYYYFEKVDQDRRRAGGVADSTADSLNKGLKSIIFQLATAKNTLGRDYAKLIHKPCTSKTTSFGKSAELWRTLVTDFSKSLEGTFYVVLDGIDETDGEPGRPLSSIMQGLMAQDEPSLTIRILLTGRPDSLRSLSIDDEDLIPEIKIAPEGQPCLNESDIMLYLSERLEDIQFFQGDKFAELKEQTKAVLGKAVRGDYSSLNLKLANIAKSRSTRDVKRELEYANESRTDGIERSIGALNLTLEEEDIVELNQLLTWEAVCFGDCIVNVYEQYLKLLGDTQSFDSLETRIRERYSSVFSLNDENRVTLTAEDIRTYLSEEDEDSKVRASEPALQDGEVNMVKRLVQKHLSAITGSEETYERFRFSDWFTAKLKDKPVHIHTGSLQECHIKVLSACLTAICDHFDEEDEYTSLFEYAWEWWGDHIFKTEVTDVPAAVLQETGRRLIRILWDTDFIDVWWNEHRTREFRRYWVYSTALTNALYNWMSQPAVRKGLVDLPPERQWLLSVINSDGPGIRILERVAKRMARRWFEQIDGVWFLSFDWLLGYLVNLEGTVPEYIDATVEQVEMIESWSKETLDNADEEGKWHSCVGRAYTILEYWDQAVARYQLAVQLLPDEWRVTLQLSKALGNNKETEKAVEMWESLIDSYSQHVEKDEDFKQTFWNTMFELVGDCKIKLKAFEKTEFQYQQLLNDEWKLKWALIQSLEKNEEYSEARTSLQDLLTYNQEIIETDEELKTEYWENMLHSMASWSVQLKEFDKAEETYRQLIAEALKRDTFEEFGYKAAMLITLALNQQSKYKETIEMLEELEKRNNAEVGTWLTVLLENYAGKDDFNERLAVAAIKSNMMWTLVEKYRMAIRAARSESNNIGTVFQLQYFLAGLFFMDPNQQETALSLWEDLMYQPLSEGLEDINWVWFARIDSAKRLASAFYTFAKQAGLNPLTPDAEKYIKRLKKLTECNPAIVRDRVKSCNITLARLHYLSGSLDRAKDVLHEFLRIAFKMIDDDDAEQRREAWCRIFQALQAVDHDENALAALRMLNPSQPEEEDEEDEEGEEEEAAGEGAEGEGEEEGEEGEEAAADEGGEGEKEEGGAEETNGEEADNNDAKVEMETAEEPQAEAGAEEVEESEAVLTNGADEHDEAESGAADAAADQENEESKAETNGVEDENNAAEETAEQEEEAAEEPLVGLFTESCDGGCDIGWTYMGEKEGTYSCRDCLDVAFESQCYAKLKAGTLEANVCSPDHQHMAYPLFDKEKWAQAGDDQIWVGDELVLKTDWIEKVKKEWRVDDASLKAQAKFLWSVRRIQRAWRLSRWLKKGKSLGDADLLMRCLI